jgi:tetratricopeptide (TPR) repeat protein
VRAARLHFVIVLTIASAACAARVVQPPVVTSPRFPQFIAPDVPAELASTLQAWSHDRGWRFLQAGDLRNAEQEFGLALRSPDFYPSMAGRGYLELARQEPRAALGFFDQALAVRPDYLSALVGRGETLLELQRETDALAAFERALAVNPGLNDVRRRVEVLRFQSLERDLAAARQAAQAGRSDQAIQLYRAAIVASPDSPFLYRELGLVEAGRGDDDAALEHFRRAVALDSSDAASIGQIARIVETRGDLAESLRLYEEALAIEPNADLARRRDLVREQIELAALPAEYQAIPDAPQITRGDLAALIGVRLGPALTQSREGVVVTDLRTHWAGAWIMAVVRAGAMQAFENHTFQPREVVERAELAETVARLLVDLAPQDRIRDWRAAAVRFSDVPTGHLAYQAASVAVASGVLDRGPDESFQPARRVTGAEAAQAVERLRAMTPLGPGSSVRR